MRHSILTPPPDVLSILLLDLQKYKEAFVGKWSRVKNPVVDTDFGSIDSASFDIDPPPGRTVDFVAPPTNI